MVQDEVALILPSESGSLVPHECNFIGEADEVDKNEAGGKKPFSIPSELSVISERWLKYLISGVSDLRTTCEQSQA